MKSEIIHVKSYRTARRRAPWAAIIARVDGGFRAFESVVDYQIWKGQK